MLFARIPICLYIMISKAQIKYIRSLQHKKYRQKFRRFIAAGDKIVHELLEGGLVKVITVYGTADWLANNEKPLVQREVEITEISLPELASLSLLSTPPGVLALCEIPFSRQHLELENKVSILAEHIQDPGNLGTIIRIADWFGIEYLVCSPGCADAYNPKTVQATMGSIGRVKVVERELPGLLSRYASVPSYAATLQGEDITGFLKIKEGFILIGNESKGLSKEVISLASYRVTIPRPGKAESLNAAVAAGIICSRLLI